MQKKVLKVFSITLSILVMCCICVLLFLSHQAQKNINKIPSYFGYKPLTVLTNSMQPTISAGDLIFIKEKKASDVKVGEIITFKVTDPNSSENNMLITHRVIGVSDKGFQTKGDNNNVQDNWEVKPNDLIGEVQTIIPNAGLIAKFVSSPFGFIIFIILPLLLFFLMEVYERMIKNLNKKENKLIS